MPKPKTCSQCGAERTGKFCGACGFEEKRGGAHRGAGRPVNEADETDIKVGKGFATRVFARIRELGLCRYATPGNKIESAEDYALEMLRAMDAPARQWFKDLLMWQLGKPVQPVMTADTRETAPELEFGNLIMPTQAASKPKPGTARKPN